MYLEHHNRNLVLYTQILVRCLLREFQRVQEDRENIPICTAVVSLYLLSIQRFERDHAKACDGAYNQYYNR